MRFNSIVILTGAGLSDDSGDFIRGKRSVKQEEAAVVRRIFAEYATGKSPRRIAADLNAEHIPSPRGGQWNASTINGHRGRRNGILQNELYTGKLVHNRVRMLRDPERLANAFPA